MYAKRDRPDGLSNQRVKRPSPPARDIEVCPLGSRSAWAGSGDLLIASCGNETDNAESALNPAGPSPVRASSEGASSLNAPNPPPSAADQSVLGGIVIRQSFPSTRRGIQMQFSPNPVTAGTTVNVTAALSNAHRAQTLSRGNENSDGPWFGQWYESGYGRELALSGCGGGDSIDGTAWYNKTCTFTVPTDACRAPETWYTFTFPARCWPVKVALHTSTGSGSNTRFWRHTTCVRVSYPGDAAVVSTASCS